MPDMENWGGAAAFLAELRNQAFDAEASEESWGGAVATNGVSIDGGLESWWVVAAVPTTEATSTATSVLSASPVVAVPWPARPMGRRRGRPCRADVFLWRLEVPSSVPEQSLVGTSRSC